MSGDEMPVYTLVSDEHVFDTEEVVADDAHQLLSLVHRFGWNSARVLRDGTHVFALSLNPKGFWSIVQDLPDNDGPKATTDQKPPDRDEQ